MNTLKKQSFTILLTWLSWSWKSTISDYLHKIFIEKHNILVDQIDWDKIRTTLNNDLKFSKDERR